MQLQKNLLLSHATGVGEPLAVEQCRLALALRIHNLAQGYSGVRPKLLEAMVALFNASYIPVIPSQGSVGASGGPRSPAPPGGPSMSRICLAAGASAALHKACDLASKLAPPKQAEAARQRSVLDWLVAGEAFGIGESRTVEFDKKKAKADVKKKD